MICKKCGNEIADNAKFCGYCGVNFEEESVQNTPQVQIPNATDNKDTNLLSSLAPNIQTIAGAIMAILLFFPLVTAHIGYGHDVDYNAFQKVWGYLMIAGALAAFEKYLRPYLKLRLGNFANLGSPILYGLGLILIKMSVSYEMSYTTGGIIAWVVTIISFVDGIYLFSQSQKK